MARFSALAEGRETRAPGAPGTPGTPGVSDLIERNAPFCANCSVRIVRYDRIINLDVVSKLQNEKGMRVIAATFDGIATVNELKIFCEWHTI